MSGTRQRETRPRVFVTGLRGLPGIMGGVETHCENLCPRLAERGFEVHILARKPYMAYAPKGSWNGLRLHRIWSPKGKYFEAALHTIAAVLYSAFKRPDLLHIHAIGPSLMVPLARIFGIKVIITHHGPDYDREKWNAFAKAVLRLGESFGTRFSNERIVISRVIQDSLREKYSAESVRIPNGVVLPSLDVLRRPAPVLEELDVESGKYVLLVSRAVPEKRHLDLIEAYKLARVSGWKLVLVGCSDHPDEYEKKVLDTVAGTPGVVSAGFRKGAELEALYARAGLFVLPSSHEGLPIVALEALSFGIPVVASDIPANLGIGLPEENYFPLGDREELAKRIQTFAERGVSDESRARIRRWIATTYDWDDIADQTAAVYRDAIGLEPERQ